MLLYVDIRQQYNTETTFVLKVAELPKNVASTPQPPTSRGILRQVNSSKSGNKRVAFVSSGSDQSDLVIVCVC